MKRCLHVLRILFFFSTFTGLLFAQHQITYWPDDRSGAVSLTFDDGLTSQLTLAIPALDKMGWKGTFFVVTDNLTSQNTWGLWRAASANGHEIASHTLTHPHLPQISSSQLQSELQQSKSIIESQIPNQKCLTFAYPFGELNATVKSAAAKYYIAARGITYDLNSPPYDYYDSKARGDDPGSSLDNMEAATDTAEANGRWLILYLHSMDMVDGYGEWGISTLSDYLDFLTTKDLWVATYVQGVIFTRERDSATLSLVSSSSSQIVLNLTHKLDTSIYNQPLTIRSEVPSTWKSVNVQQGSNYTTVSSLIQSGKTIVYYYAMPNGGSITLAQAGLKITALNPTSIAAGSANFTLEVTGTNFANGAMVRWNGSNRPTTYVSANKLNASISAADVAVPGVASITVANSSSDISSAFSLQIQTPSVASVSMNPTSVTGGSSSTATVTLNMPAPSGGASVSLISTNPAVAIVPASVTVPAASTSVTFSVATTPVLTSTAVSISATYNGTVQTNLTVATPGLSSLALSPTSVTGGNSSTGTVTLTGSAPTGGITVSLTDNSSSASEPVSVVVSEGRLSATFTVATTAVSSSTTATITATSGSTSKTATITIAPPALSSLTLNPTAVVGGVSAQGTVTLTGLAPSAGISITLSDNSSAASEPTSVTVTAGNTNATFTITTTTVTSSQSATITAKYGSISKTAALTVASSVTLYSVSLNPTTVVGGNGSTGTVTLTGPAPAAGTTVSLTDNSSSASVPASITVAAGSSSATFAVTTTAVSSSTTVTITAANGNTSKTASLTVSPTAALSSVSLNPTSVTGGNSSQATVTLTAAAPAGGVSIDLSDNSSNASEPASVNISAGSTTATFAISTTAVSASSQVTISASYVGITKTAVLTLTPPAMTVLTTSGWTLKYADSQELVGENGAATNAFDGNANTIWHTAWYTSSPNLPHDIQIDMGASYTVGGFRYLPRQDGEVNGRIGQYEFYISQDGVNWGTAVATGSFANNASEKEVLFTTGTARYVRLRALTEVNGNPWTSVAELKVLGLQ